jgi:sugar phosphate permease
LPNAFDPPESTGRVSSRLRDPNVRRWLLWGTLAVVFLLVNVYRLSTAVITEQLMAAFLISGAQLGTLHAAFFYVYALMQIPTGVLADRVGPRLTAAAGALVMNAGAIWFALADTYLGAFAARTLIGLGGSVIFVSILKFCANWFRADEFATVSGLTFAISGVGGVLATTPLAVAIDAAGWRSTIALLGGLGLVFAGLTLAVVRDSPERAGLPPIEGVPERSTPSLGEVREHTKGVLRDRHTWVVSLLLFCITGLNLTLFGLWGIPYVVQTYGVSVAYASLFTLLGSVGVMIGPPAIGWLSDRIGRRTELMIAGGTGYTASLAVIAVVGDPPLVVVALAYFLVGSLFGGFVLSYTMTKERHPPAASGIATGTINGAAFLGAAVLPTLMGWVLDAYWTGEVVDGARVYTAAGYRVAFGIATACGLVGLLCAIWLHRRA